MPKASKTGVRGLYRGEDGRYRIDLRWKAPDGSPRRHKEKLPPGVPAAAAKKRAQDILSAALGGTLGNARGPRVLRKAFDEYLSWIEGAGAGQYVDARRARKDKAGHFNAWIAAAGDVQLASVGVATFEQFKAYEIKRGVGPATINRRLTTMKHFLARAAAWGWIDRARALELRAEMKLLPEPQGRLRWLTDAERHRLDFTMPLQLKAVVDCAMLTGLRLGSIVGMVKSDIDFGARTLAVDAKRKGQRARLHLPISDALAVVLRAAMARSKGDHVFVSSRGEAFTSGGVSSFFRRIAERAKVPDLSFHALRHDAATRMRRAGVPIEDVKEILGHADLHTTQRYAHVGREALARAVNTLAVAPSLPPLQKDPRPRRRKAQ